MKKREIKKYGNSYAVKLEPADIKDYNLLEGNQLDMEETLNIGKIINKEDVKKDGNKKQ